MRSPSGSAKFDLKGAGSAVFGKMSMQDFGSRGTVAVGGTTATSGTASDVPASGGALATAATSAAMRASILRNIRAVDAVHAAMTDDKRAIWQDLRFTHLFKGDDWRGTAKGGRLERDLCAVGVSVVYLPYTASVSSSALRRVLCLPGMPTAS